MKTYAINHTTGKVFSLMLFFLLSLNVSLPAQKGSDEALQKLLHSEFMVKFREMKKEVEIMARHFKSVQHQYQPEEIIKVEKAYSRAARRFNEVLEGMKNDLQDKKKMRYIRNYPESYANGLELELYKLSDSYAGDFHQVVRDITQDEVDGSALLLILSQVLGLTKYLVTEIVQMSQTSRLLSEQQLNEGLMGPNTLPGWEELNPFPGGDEWPTTTFPQGNFADPAGQWNQNGF